jgi:hypothetical protein
MITETKIDGRVRRLAPKRPSEIHVGDRAVLACAMHGHSAGTACTVVEWAKTHMAVRFGPNDAYLGYVVHHENLLFPVEEETKRHVIEDCEFRFGEPAKDWSPTKGYAIEATPPYGAFVTEHRRSPDKPRFSWMCRIEPTSRATLTTHVRVPGDMPGPAREALRRWLADRIVVEDANR